MLGLFKKDLKSMAQQGRIILILMVFYGALAFLSQENLSMMVGFISMFSMILPVSAMGYDEKARWDHYALTMPISRNMLVWSKYLLSLLLSLVCAFMSFGILTMDTSLGLAGALCTAAGIWGALLVLSSILYPFYFKLGSEKGRYVMMAIFLLPTLGVLAFSRMGVSLPSVNENALEAALLSLPLSGTALFLLSGLISCRIYSKKEF